MKHIKYQAIIDRDRLARLQAALLAWFGVAGRSLPWRETRDPYAILVAEILLHQTGVDVVAPVYQQFLAAFPTVAHLAAAPLEEVKAVTDPLGYKIRGRWLKDIAATVMDRHNGQVPDTLEELMALPGVGRYTAGACLSFAYGRRAGVLDTNVARIASRVFALSEEVVGAERLHRLWALAEAMVPEEDAWSFNQALMDLGSLVCTARKPKCLLCPWGEWCPSRSSNGRAAEASDAVGVVFWGPVTRRTGQAPAAASDDPRPTTESGRTRRRKKTEAPPATGQIPFPE